MKNLLAILFLSAFIGAAAAQGVPPSGAGVPCFSGAGVPNCGGSGGGGGGAITALYWVPGGNGNTNSSTNWASSSGGAPGAGVPSNITALNFDSNSGSGTASIISPLTAASLTLNNTAITINDTVGTNISGTFTLNGGSFISNGNNEVWGAFASTSSSTRVLNLTGSSINLTGSNQSVFSFSSATGLTATLTGTNTYVVGFSAGITASSLVFPNITFTGGGDMVVGGATFGNLTVLGNNNPLFNNVFAPGALVVTGKCTFTGAAQNNRVLIQGRVNPSTSISCGSGAFTNTEWRQVAATGAAAPFTGTTMGDVGGNSNITFPASATYYWVGGTGNWSFGSHWATTSGGAASGLVPLPQDTAHFDANSFPSAGAVVTMDYSEYAGFDFTGVTNNPTLLMAEGANLCGNVTLNAGMTTAPSTTLLVDMTFYKYGSTNTLTTNGITWSAGLGVNLGTGSLTLGSDLVQVLGAKSTHGLAFEGGGTFSDGGHNVTLAGPVIDQTTTARTLTMSGIWTIQYPTGNIWNYGAFANATLTATGSTLKLAAAPTGTRTFAGGGKTFNKFEWVNEGIASTLLLTGANTFSDFKVDADTAARTLTMPAGVTNTSTTTELSGSAGNLLTINSSTAGTQGTLSQASGTVAGTFLSLKDSKATGGATFTATSSVDAGNNTGWTITP